MSSLNYSEVESLRFGKEIFRANAEVLDIHLLKQFYEQNDPDVLIIRMPVTEQHKIFQLNMLNKEVIYADTLVCYQVYLNDTNYNLIRNKNLTFVTANSSDKGVFEQLIPEIFNNYANHYFSNPMLDKTKIAEGYLEWAVKNINIAHNLNLLVYTENKPVGFINCSNSGVAEIVLNGVLPAYEGRGIYMDMVRYVKDYFHRLDISVLRVSTQIWNFAVQKVWNKEGFILNDAFVTVHLNKKVYDPI